MGSTITRHGALAGPSAPSTQPASPADGRAPTNAGAADTTPAADDWLAQSIPSRSEGLAIGGFLAAAAGVVIWKRPISSKVIGAVEGAKLLSNPSLPARTAARWGVPTHGTLFGTAPGPRVSIEHADQGALPDCWNVAGIAAIAHRRPEVFERMVREVGDHIVVDLPGRSVAVTKELPLTPSGKPAFAASGDDGVLWPAYVEKAQAAVSRGGYRALGGGQTRFSFRDLLGTDPVRVPSRGSIHDDVVHHLRAGTPVTLSAKKLTSAAMRAANVHGDHYYVAVEEIGRDGSSRVRLFNPWGEKHPTRALDARELAAMFSGLDTPNEYVRYGAAKYT
ncbi:MAG: peptidase calpain [Thermoleophilia bacterium]|nr:peptidase calpain [Thermoleophilia bacterium]